MKLEAHPLPQYPHWQCPCGTEPPGPGSRTTPDRTIVSLRVPVCPHCRRPFLEEYRRDGEASP